MEDADVVADVDVEPYAVEPLELAVLARRPLAVTIDMPLDNDCDEDVMDCTVAWVTSMEVTCCRSLRKPDVILEGM